MIDTITHVPPQYWYRIEDYLEGDEYCSWAEIRVRKLLVVKTTPKGVWLNNGKFCLTSARKSYAKPTLPLAVESFRQRKLRQIRLPQAQISRVEQSLDKLPDVLTIDFREYGLTYQEIAQCSPPSPPPVPVSPQALTP